jgi:hypothetical protein
MGIGGWRKPAFFALDYPELAQFRKRFCAVGN